MTTSKRGVKKIIEVNWTPASAGVWKDEASKAAVRKAWLQQQDPICAACGKRCWNHGGAGPYPDRATVDHIIPVSKGGADKASNWKLLCRSCNVSKGSSIEVSDQPLAKNEADLSGICFGKLVVLGKHPKRASDGARWVVRCACGNHEVRAAKKIKSPTDPFDCCIECKKAYRGIR